MKKLAIFLLIILMILLFLSRFGYYTRDEYGDGYGVTWFVLSGKYYVDCKSGDVIKKKEPKFPYKKINNSDYKINVGRLTENQKKQLGKYNVDTINFSYLYSESISGYFTGHDVYFSKITLDGEKLLVWAFHDTDGKLTISIGPEYDFEKYKTNVEDVKRSCLLPQF